MKLLLRTKLEVFPRTIASKQFGFKIRIVQKMSKLKLLASTLVIISIHVGACRRYKFECNFLFVCLHSTFVRVCSFLDRRNNKIACLL